MILRHEGEKLRLYQDTKGIWTIGSGRNIQANGISIDESALMRANDIKAAEVFLQQFTWYTSQSDVRRAAIIDMCFMGPERLLHFINMIHYLTVDDYEKAAHEVVNSQWYTDVGPARGESIRYMIETGAWPPSIFPQTTVTA